MSSKKQSDRVFDRYPTPGALNSKSEFNMSPPFKTSETKHASLRVVNTWLDSQSID